MSLFQQALDDNQVLAELVQVTKTFHTDKGPLIACDNINLRIETGKSVGLVGESGSGKSTLVRVLQLLTRPTSGQVWMNGVEVSKLPERRLKPFRRTVQFVAQDPFGSLFPHLSVARNIMEPMRVHQEDDIDTRERRAAELMERVGLPTAYFHTYPHELSGGQQQRVAIARALALNPSMLILDEAVSSLDVSIQAQILNLLQSLKDDLGLTYVFISHNLAVIRLICETTAVMYMGRIVEQGPSHQIFKRPTHPYTRSLIASIPTFTQDDVTPLPSESILTGERPTLTDLPVGCSYQSRCPFVSEECRVRRPDLAEVSPEYAVACHQAQLLQSGN